MRKKLDTIKMLVLDVDGVLTDGTILVDSRGRESKSFSIIDGHGIKMWKRAGLKIALLSGRACATTKHQAKELAVDFCLNGRRDKLKGLKELIKMSKTPAGQIAYVGDDLPDLPVIQCAGFSAAVANAVDEIKRAADYVTKRKGGEGAVREVIEHILKKTGRWDALVKKYMHPSASLCEAKRGGVADSPRQRGIGRPASPKTASRDGQKKQSVTPGKSKK